jgi:nucleoside-diphosphate-sugar epimerase
MTSGKHALVFGASGISGWALCDQLLEYPSKDTFAKVHGLKNRPLTKEDALLPADPRLELVSGINLSESLETVKKALQEKVKDVKGVTHVFFMGMFLRESPLDCSV